MTARPAPPVTVRDDVPGWLPARRYGVLASMVAATAERRAAGDWRGACAAARTDVAVGRTLLAALFDGAPASVVGALLDAGADQAPSGEYDETVAEIVEWTGRDDLDVLLAGQRTGKHCGA